MAQASLDNQLKVKSFVFSSVTLSGFAIFESQMRFISGGWFAVGYIMIIQRQSKSDTEAGEGGKECFLKGWEVVER